MKTILGECFSCCLTSSVSVERAYCLSCEIKECFLIVSKNNNFPLRVTEYVGSEEEYFRSFAVVCEEEKAELFNNSLYQPFCYSRLLQHLFSKYLVWAVKTSRIYRCISKKFCRYFEFFFILSPSIVEKGKIERESSLYRGRVTPNAKNMHAMKRVISRIFRFQK